jgi:hypothetical protein
MGGSMYPPPIDAEQSLSKTERYLAVMMVFILLFFIIILYLNISLLYG